MKSIYFIVSFSIFLSPMSVPAEMPDGASDPAFQEAVEIWLSDDDATSLPMLAKLAREGNAAAQILLGQIEHHEANPSQWVGSLSRDERRALFRAPGGKFGTSWLKIAAEDSDLARALSAARDPEQMEQIIPQLNALGETRAIGPVVARLINHGKWERLVGLELQGALPPEQRYAAWYAALFVSSEEARRLRVDASRSVHSHILNSAMYFVMARSHIEATSTAFTEKYWKTYWPLMLFIANGVIDPERPETAETFAKVILEAEYTRPVASACRARCSAASTTCVTTAWMILGGFRDFLELGSPVATLIPPDQYGQSHRATGELLRRLAHGTDYPSSKFDTIEKSSLCLARALFPIIQHSERER